jgi:hypothetical protein
MHGRQGDHIGYVLYCEKATKGVVLGKELAHQIAEAVGIDDTDRWPGKKIILYPEQMTVAGERVTAIRARKVASQVPAPAAASEQAKLI